jgi:hypothetical protein
VPSTSITPEQHRFISLQPVLITASCRHSSAARARSLGSLSLSYQDEEWRREDGRRKKKQEMRLARENEEEKKEIKNADEHHHQAQPRQASCLTAAPLCAPPVLSSSRRSTQTQAKPVLQAAPAVLSGRRCPATAKHKSMPALQSGKKQRRRVKKRMGRAEKKKRR